MGTVSPVLAVGLTGTIASGKEEVASLFVAAGFEFFSLSDRVREEAARQGFQPPSRADLQRIGNELRGRFGPAIWAARTYEKVVDAGVTEAVVDGFRNPGEVVFFQERTQFHLVAVDARSEVRFRRLLERRRPGDPQNLDDFLHLDARDRGVGEGDEGQQVGACLRMAHFTISNDGTLDDLKQKIDGVLTQIRQKSH